MSDSSAWLGTRPLTLRWPTSTNWLTTYRDRPVIVLDPMLATGGSLMYVIDLLRSARQPT
jgi:uracil phosphoribosyltransferase